MFWEYHDELFARQDQFAPGDADNAREVFIAIATDLGLDVDQFTQELDDGVYASYVAMLEQEAAGLGMTGTPAVIFNGELLQQVPPSAFYWNAFVDLALLEESQYESAPEMNINVDSIYRATVTMESGDQFVMDLYPASAPQTVNSFVFLANEGWFDGVQFHRVLPGFVAQTGDPTGLGMGGPGYAIPNEIDPALTHAETGMVAMANSGPDTNGSQWYITLGDAAFLDGQYSIFGRVVEGMDVVQGITPRDPSQNPEIPAGDRIETIEIEEVAQ
jgi:cyclophilin family peptidyl-prolyl cis-trans isomerase